MRSSTLIFILVIAILVSFLGLFFFGFEGGFGGRGHGMGAEIPRSFWLVLSVVPLVVATAVLGYALVFPELSEGKPVGKPSGPEVERGEPALDAVLRVLNDDERKVAMIVVGNSGKELDLTKYKH